MAEYPNEEDFHWFIETLQKGNFQIKKYLPPISEQWYELVFGCVEYVRNTAQYEELDFFQTCAKLLYKVAKRHELGDGNKRSSVMVVFLFCLLNDYYIYDPAAIKRLAKRTASTKGRANEMMMRKRLAAELRKITGKFGEPDPRNA